MGYLIRSRVALISHMAEPLIYALASAMQARYGTHPDDVRVIRAPYRICPLGAHVDHQLGTVTAFAIDRAVHLAYVPSESPHIRMQSIDYPGEVEFALGDSAPSTPGEWGNYLRGAVSALAEKFELSEGILGVTSGTLAESGLASSAAIGVAYLLALEDVNRIRVTDEQNIRLDQAIENGYLGLSNGIMDQAAILRSRKDHLSVIDCKTGQCGRLPKAEHTPPFTWLLVFSGIREQQQIVTEFNTRVAECVEAARLMLDAVGRKDVDPLLGNVRQGEYEMLRETLPAHLRSRTDHFFTERTRVHAGAAAWQAGDIEHLGRLISESGASSIENYESGSPALVDLYEILADTPGVYGTRFSGAGFRGCCIALVNPRHADTIAEHVLERYCAKQGTLAKQAEVIRVETDNGARWL